MLHEIFESLQKYHFKIKKTGPTSGTCNSVCKFWERSKWTHSTYSPQWQGQNQSTTHFNIKKKVKDKSINSTSNWSKGIKGGESNEKHQLKLRKTASNKKRQHNLAKNAKLNLPNAGHTR